MSSLHRQKKSVSKSCFGGNEWLGSLILDSILNERYIFKFLKYDSDSKRILPILRALESQMPCLLAASIYEIYNTFQIYFAFLLSLASPALLENGDTYLRELKLSSLHFQKYAMTIRPYFYTTRLFSVICFEIVLLLLNNTSLNESEKSKPGKISLLLPISIEDYNCNYDFPATLLYPISVTGFYASLIPVALSGKQGRSRGTVAQMWKNQRQ